MAQEQVREADVHHWLLRVGVESLCQWDVLTFLHRHPTTLMSPTHLARLLGYRVEPVVAALDSLAALQLLQSAQSRGASVYQLIVPPVRSRRHAVERLLALSDRRSGRLLLGKHLGRGDRAPHEGLQATRQFLDDSNAILNTIIDELEDAALALRASFSGGHVMNIGERLRGRPSKTTH